MTSLLNHKEFRVSDSMEIELRVGSQIHDWTLLEYMGNKYWKCKCICGTIKSEIREYDLIHSKSKSCGCSKHRDLLDRQIGNWKVIKYSGDKKYLCECSCGNKKEVHGTSLRSGKSRSCGGVIHKIKYNLAGEQFGDWEVLYYTEHNKWMCRCECGNTGEVGGFQLRNGLSKSCGHTHKLIDLAGMVYGELTVESYAGNGDWLCHCSCGFDKYVAGKSLRNGSSTSCGCSKIRKLQKIKNDSRTIDQLDIILSEEKLRHMLSTNKLSYLDIANILGITYSHAVKICNKHNLSELVNKNQKYLQLELLKYVREYIGDSIEIISNDREVLKGMIDKNGTKHTYELDIYIPSRSVAIEFNGDYWHSDKYKDPWYHQLKTLACESKGIRLIHIFEYEWVNPEYKGLIKKYLADLLGEKEVIHVDQCIIEEIDYITISKFLELNHLHGADGIEQGGIYIALKDNAYTSRILGVIAFNVIESHYELIRICTLHRISIIDGEAKLFRYFVDKYKPSSIIAYVDITKYTGKIYRSLGFNSHIPEDILAPRFNWVNPVTKEYYTEDQVTKQKLSALQIGEVNESELYTMDRLGVVRIYNSGYIKYEYDVLIKDI